MKLENAFEGNHYVVGQERKDLAKSLNLSETQVLKINFILCLLFVFNLNLFYQFQVKVWFQNRRTKHKRGKSDDDDEANDEENEEDESEEEEEEEENERCRSDLVSNPSLSFVHDSNSENKCGQNENLKRKSISSDEANETESKFKKAKTDSAGSNSANFDNSDYFSRTNFATESSSSYLPRQPVSHYESQMMIYENLIKKSSASNQFAASFHSNPATSIN